MRGCAAWALALIAMAWPATAASQAEDQRCDQTREAGFRRIRNARGEETIFISGPARFVCTGGTVVEADSAVWQRSIGALELIGHVLYRDSVQTLTSDWANYLGGGSELYARGSVVLTDRKNGSTVRGEELEYRQATEERPWSRAVVQGGRPHAVFRPARDSAAPGPEEDTVPPIEVDADWMEFLGDSLFRARDHVVIVRGTTNAYSESAQFDRTGERMLLRDAARVVDPEYSLRADEIDAWLGGSELREVHARGDGELDSEDLSVRAPRIFIGFLQGGVETLSAWVPPPVADTTPADRAAVPDPSGMPETPTAPVRALAFAEDFRLEADSIHALAPGQRMERVTAVGNAFGERQEDSLSVNLPRAIARDWIRGDTIIGYFVEPPDSVTPPMDSLGIAADTTVGIGYPTMPPADSARLAAPAPDTGEVTLKRVVVVGALQPARSLYRLDPPDDEPGARPGINFMAARRITLHMVDGDVSRVEAVGPIQGIYLDPERTPVAPADSAAPPPTVADPIGTRS